MIIQNDMDRNEPCHFWKHYFGCIWRESKMPVFNSGKADQTDEIFNDSEDKNCVKLSNYQKSNQNAKISLKDFYI